MLLSGNPALSGTMGSPTKASGMTRLLAVSALRLPVFDFSERAGTSARFRQTLLRLSLIRSIDYS